MNQTISEVDLAAYNRHGQPVVFVQTKSWMESTEDWAAQYRRNILSHDTLPHAPFFLIATPNRFYFWRQTADTERMQAPHFILEGTAELRPYFEQLGDTPDQVDRQTFEELVYFWLHDLCHFGLPDAHKDAAHYWLFESGLMDQLRQCKVVRFDLE